MTTALRARPTGTPQPLSEHYQPAQWASRVHQRKTRLVRGNSGAASGNSVPGGARPLASRGRWTNCEPLRASRLLLFRYTLPPETATTGLHSIAVLCLPEVLDHISTIPPAGRVLHSLHDQRSKPSVAHFSTVHGGVSRATPDACDLVPNSETRLVLLLLGC